VICCKNKGKITNRFGNTLFEKRLLLTFIILLIYGQAGTARAKDGFYSCQLALFEAGTDPLSK